MPAATVAAGAFARPSLVTVTVLLCRCCVMDVAMDDVEAEEEEAVLACAAGPLILLQQPDTVAWIAFRASVRVTSQMYSEVGCARWPGPLLGFDVRICSRETAAAQRR